MEVVLALATNVSAQNEVDWCHDPKLRGGCGSSRKVVGLIWSMRASQFALFGTQAARRERRRQEDDDVAQRAARAAMGELSAARQALEGASVAPGTLRTMRDMTNPEKRPIWPRSPIPPDIDDYEPEEQLNLSSGWAIGDHR